MVPALSAMEGGPNNLDILDPDGSYEGFQFDANNNIIATITEICVANDIPGYGFTCMPAPPKAWCPYIAGGAALGAKWSIALGFNKYLGDVAGLVVGLGVNQVCNKVLAFKGRGDGWAFHDPHSAVGISRSLS